MPALKNSWTKKELKYCPVFRYSLRPKTNLIWNAAKRSRPRTDKVASQTFLHGEVGHDCCWNATMADGDASHWEALDFRTTVWKGDTFDFYVLRVDRSQELLSPCRFRYKKGHGQVRAGIALSKDLLIRRYCLILTSNLAERWMAIRCRPYSIL